MRIDRIRRDSLALQNDWSLRFHETENEQIVCYTKPLDDRDTVIAVVVNLNPHHMQSGWVRIPSATVQLDPLDSFQAQELISGARFLWHGAENYGELDRGKVSAHIFRLRRRLRREQDFDYFM